MAAVVRIKRRLDEDPLETLVLNCKRRKTSDAGAQISEDVSAVLKLARTAPEEENIDTVLRKHHVADIAELKEQFKRHSVNISEKIRCDMKESSKNSRYRVVNCFRKTLNNSETNEEVASTSTSEVTVLDIETDYNKNESTVENRNSTVEDETKYVYDFYYTNSDDFGEADIEEYVRTPFWGDERSSPKHVFIPKSLKARLIKKVIKAKDSVYPLHDPLIFGSIRDNGIDEQNTDDDSEDSNAECNWRNDYPDEDDLASINDEDMIDAVNNLNIEEDLLSSDSGEEDLVYSREEKDFQDEGLDIDKEDELRYGKLYAKFKAVNKEVKTTEVPSDFYYGDIDEDEYYY